LTLAAGAALGSHLCDATAALARDVVDVVGDACVVRVMNTEGRLAAIAVDHRDAGQLWTLQPLLDAAPIDARTGWSGQAVRKNTPVWLESVPWGELAGPPAGREPRRGLIVPLRSEDGVAGVLAVGRPIAEPPYSLGEQLHVERLAARARPQLDLRVPSRERPQPVPPVAPPTAQRMLELSASGVWVTDRKGRTVFVSEAVSELLGVPVSAVEGLPMAAFLDEEPQTVYGALHRDAEEVDHEIVRPDGTRRWASIRSTPWLDDWGCWCGTVNAITDVTERKAAQVKLRLLMDAQRQLAQLAAAAARGECMDALLELAVETVAQVLGVDHVGVGEMVGPDRVRPLRWLGWDDDEVDSELELAPWRSTRLALEYDEPLVVRDYDEEPFRAGALLESHGLRSGIYVRVGSQAVLTANGTEPRDFSPEEIGFVQDVADLLAARWPEPAYAVA
jgi:PAS domain S-box-containing protein